MLNYKRSRESISPKNYSQKKKEYIIFKISILILRIQIRVMIELLLFISSFILIDYLSVKEIVVIIVLWRFWRILT